MFVPPPSKINLEIVAQSISGRRFYGLRKRAAIGTLGLVSCAFAGLLAIVNINSLQVQQMGDLISTDVELKDVEVLLTPGPFLGGAEVRKIWPTLEKAADQIGEENRRVLLSRAPKGGAIDSIAPQEQALVASSGDWLLGRVRLSDSGLVVIRPDLAVFEKGRQQAVFRPGAVLPNGEVVIEVNASELLIKTNMRFIQIVDDGA